MGGRSIFMNAKCRELFCWCHLRAKMNDISKECITMITADYSNAFCYRKKRDLPNNHMQVFYFMSAGLSLLHALFSCLVSLSSKVLQLLTKANYPKKIDKNLIASLWKTSQRGNIVRNCHPIKCKTVILCMPLC